MWIRSNGSFSDITLPRGNGAVAGCQKSNTISSAITLIVPEERRKFTKDDLGCVNILLPRYLDALEEADIEAVARRGHDKKVSDEINDAVARGLDNGAVAAVAAAAEANSASAAGSAAPPPSTKAEAAATHQTPKEDADMGLPTTGEPPEV